MTKTGYISVRVEPKLKAEAEKVLHELGLSVSDAITIFFRQIVLQQGLPFETRLPSPKKRK